MRRHLCHDHSLSSDAAVEAIDAALVNAAAKDEEGGK
jgi:hypothetical protein